MLSHKSRGYLRLQVGSRHSNWISYWTVLPIQSLHISSRVLQNDFLTCKGIQRFLFFQWKLLRKIHCEKMHAGRDVHVRTHTHTHTHTHIHTYMQTHARTHIHTRVRGQTNSTLFILNNIVFLYFICIILLPLTYMTCDENLLKNRFVKFLHLQ